MSGLRLDIIPGRGIGPVELGMTPSQVTAGLDAAGCHDLDDSNRPLFDRAFANSLQIDYDCESRCRTVGVYHHPDCGCEYFLSDRSLIDFSANELFVLLSQLDGGDHVYSEQPDYFFPNIGTRVFDLSTSHDYRDNGTRLVYGELLISRHHRANPSPPVNSSEQISTVAKSRDTHQRRAQDPTMSREEWQSTNCPLQMLDSVHMHFPERFNPQFKRFAAECCGRLASLMPEERRECVFRVSQWVDDTCQLDDLANAIERTLSGWDPVLEADIVTREMIADVMLAFLDHADSPHKLARLVAMRSQHAWESAVPNGGASEQRLQADRLRRLIPYERGSR